MRLPDVLSIFGIGTYEALFIILLIMLLFGAAKIPELARALGKAQREFTKARNEIEREVASPPPAVESEEQRLRRKAKEVGVATEGKSVDEIRSAVADWESQHAPKE